ncbi:MAG: hypothetical protein OEL54_03670 [Flavobacteriaceae bacterium]|nr:hypothetical protein [Flavobacteriaceae bacterium]
MLDLNTFQLDSQEGLATADPTELLKAMEAGLGTGRDYTDQTHNGQGLKVESLDSVVKVLQNKMEHLKIWSMIPKNTIYNTVHEYNQLLKYGEDVGIFNLEGETPQFTDTQYKRKAATTKFMGLGGQVSHAAMLVKRSDGKNALAAEVENKTILLLTELNKLMISADSTKVATQFDGFWKNHLDGICDITGGISGLTSEQYLDKYFGDVAVIDARGGILTDALVNDAAQAAMNDRFGMISDIVSNPIVFKDYDDSQLGLKRLNVTANASSAIAVGGIMLPTHQTSFGAISRQSDIFFDKKIIKKYNSITTNDKAPTVPVKDGSTPIAVNTDTKTAFTGEAGNYFYAITAKNRYGESAMVIINTSTQAVTATQSVDIKFAAGVGGYAAESFVLYRANKDVVDYTTANFYPIIEVSTTELSSGWDGGGSSIIRDRNRFMTETHSAMVMYNSADYWEYLQLAPTMKMDFAVTSPSRRFAILNYGTPVWFQPGKMVRIINIGRP